MHALGHIAANLSFAAVAISLTHTVKTLEPAFNVVLSQLILGQSTPLPAVLSLIPIMVRAKCMICMQLLNPDDVPCTCPSMCCLGLVFGVGVGLASAGELSFNWMGFSTAMLSNLTFGFRAAVSARVTLNVHGHVKDAGLNCSVRIHDSRLCHHLHAASPSRGGWQAAGGRRRGDCEGWSAAVLGRPVHGRPAIPPV
eukprot:353182-Chlamydomonas_euryale.AAC.55